MNIKSDRCKPAFKYKILSAPHRELVGLYERDRLNMAKGNDKYLLLK
jgi:hypothetical protein